LPKNELMLIQKMPSDDFYAKYIKNIKVDLSSLTNKDRDDHFTIFCSNKTDLSKIFLIAAVDDKFKNKIFFNLTHKLSK